MKGNMSYFVIKIDLTKIYDMLKWSFIKNILKDMEFTLELITIIMTYTTLTINVKWNITRSTFFKPQRGIRQGEPIYLYLFVVCMDKLSHLISHSVSDKALGKL